MKIVCGFCSAATDDALACVNCHHDPALPYTQRASAPVRADARLRLSEAQRALGPHATADAIAEHLDVSVRTVRRWQADVRPVA
jgi:hypothetical protein